MISSCAPGIPLAMAACSAIGKSKSEWMLFWEDDIGANVQRISDNKKFLLGLSELKATDKKSKNYQLLDDYAVWFVNYR